MPEFVARTMIATQWAAPGRFPVVAPNLSIEEMPLGGIVRIQSRSVDPEWMARIGSAAGPILPTQGQCHVGPNADRFVVWIAPGEWLYFCPLVEETSRMNGLEEACAEHLAVATLVSDSRVGFRLTGAEAQALLAKGTALNVDSDAFPPGSSATTRFAGLAAVMIHRRAGEYLIYFDVAYSEFLMHWWLDAADEFLAPAN